MFFESLYKGIKSTQEQAIASWISFLVKTRINQLIEELTKQNINFEKALEELDELKKFIGDPKHILGSNSTKHGEIAEHMQVNIANARNLIKGLKKNHTFEGVGRTAPEDYIRNGLQVQSKFYNGLKNTLFGKHALFDHMKTYPDFVKNGGVYDIPKDQYEMMVKLLDKYKTARSELGKPDADYGLAEKIYEALNKNGLKLGEHIKPAVVKYDEVQLMVAGKTVDNEKQNIYKEDKKIRDASYAKAKPSLKEGMKATGVSAAIEGGVDFCLVIAKKRKEKKFSSFSIHDWEEIGLDTGKGVVLGGVRGATIYGLTNFTKTPANVASAYVTATIGVASQITAFSKGQISKEDLIINSEAVCMDVGISAISSALGQSLIPIPVLGAVIGNVTGQFVYEISKQLGEKQVQKFILEYENKMNNIQQNMDSSFQKLITSLNEKLNRFKSLETYAFDENINIGFQGSIMLAVESGVSEGKVLKSVKEINSFFRS